MSPRLFFSALWSSANSMQPAVFKSIESNDCPAKRAFGFMMLMISTWKWTILEALVNSGN
jgi:hypothetical protein